MTELERELKRCVKLSKDFEVEKPYYRGLRDAYRHLEYFIDKKAWWKFW